MVNKCQIELFKKPDNFNWFEGAINSLKINESPGWPDTFGETITKWFNKNSINKIRTLSLFSGGGGLDIGFHDAGFQIVECNEIVPAFSTTLQNNTALGKRFSGTNVVCKDINNYDPELTKIDFIIGGPPCQTFSAAGARAAGVNGTDDERGNLFLQYARLIHKLQPQGFLFENVYRIIGAQSGKPWKQIQAAFEELGYKLHWRIIDAADYGVPQFRERLIIVGLKSGTFDFPFPSHGPDSSDDRPYYSAGIAVASAKNIVIPKKIGGRHGQLLDDIPPGLNYSFYTEKMGHPTPYFSWRAKFSDYLYKADPDTPVRTIKAQGGQYTGPFSWENRPFTIEELKRLQTFPDNYELNGNRQTVIHQLGNSVPPQLARILALSILDQIFKKPIPFEMSYMPRNFELGFRARKSALSKVYGSKAKQAINNINGQCLKSNEPEFHGELSFNITRNLCLVLISNNLNSEYSASYYLKDRQLFVNLKANSKKRSSAKFKIIAKASKVSSSTSISEINITSYLSSENSLFASWKCLEYILKSNVHKDDLVQFFGYYQSNNLFDFEMQLVDKKLLKDSFWEITKNITQGIGVSKILNFEELAGQFNTSIDILFDTLTRLKNVGFEIRNNNTNKQIKPGFVLIPYSFPTLNERSLQRQTRL